jgi:hypothetical protein
MFFTQCGKRNPDGAQFCFACGRALVTDVESAAVAPPPPVSSGMYPAAAGLSVIPQRTAGGAQQCPTCGLFNPATAENCDCGFNFITGQTAPTRTQYAGFWTRLAAAVIDSFVIVGLSLAGALAFGAADLLTGAVSEAAVAGYYIVPIFASWLYYAICESSSKQATLGKRVVGIVVTDVSGRPLSFGCATGRAERAHVWDRLDCCSFF